MTTSDIVFNHQNYHQQISTIWNPTLKRLDTLIRRFVWFHILFSFLALVEVGYFISAVRSLTGPSVLAFTLGLFFLTLFAFLVLRLYLISRRPDHIGEMVEDYLSSCKELIRYQEGIPEHHIALANAAHKLAHHLHEKEYHFFAPPPFLKSLAPTFEIFSCFCHWKDLFSIRELLLQTAIEEHIKVVKCEPTNLEVHAALANAYVTLSALYKQTSDEEKWIPPAMLGEEMKESFRETSRRAIEEFKILNAYAPDDPWVHMQLAYSYHDLSMPQEEIAEYEILLKLKPNDTDTLFKLGMLYFQQEQNARGLRIYELLKKSNFKKAEALIHFYGSSK